MDALTEQQFDTKPSYMTFLKSLTLFSGLLDEDIACFAAASHVKSYEKGQQLYLEGEKANFFYIICNGWVKLFHVTEDGEEVSLAVLTNNSVTGENAIFE